MKKCSKHGVFLGNTRRDLIYYKCSVTEWVAPCATRDDIVAYKIIQRACFAPHRMAQIHARIQTGLGVGRGSGPCLENHIAIGFLSNTGPDPLKITKVTSQHSMLGHH